MKWITRARPKIDRIACPWLIARYVDPAPEFIFVEGTAVITAARALGATPFDVPGVELSHAGGQCSFDAFIRKYAIRDTVIGDLADIVRAADTGTLDTSPQAAGLLAVSLGLSHLFADDQVLLRHGMLIYDALFAWLRDWRDETHGSPPIEWISPPAFLP